MTTPAAGHHRGHDGHKGKIWFLFCVLCVLCGDSPLNGQLAVGIEPQRDRFTYHFDNPSTFDTTALVPHFFEQRYNADNIWLTATARHLAGIRWETIAGVTPSRASTGDDYDTFFDPDGTVIVAGTTGGISIQSLRVGQRGEIGHAGPVAVSVGYRLTVDRSDFQLGHKDVTRNSVIVTAFDVTSREFTGSQMHELIVGGRFKRGSDSDWQLAVSGDIAPVTLGRLVVELPDKYPGVDLVFIAKVAAANGGASVSRRVNGWTIELGTDGGATWSYDAANSLSRRHIAVHGAIGR